MELRRAVWISSILWGKDHGGKLREMRRRVDWIRLLAYGASNYFVCGDPDSFGVKGREWRLELLVGTAYWMGFKEGGSGVKFLEGCLVVRVGSLTLALLRS